MGILALIYPRGNGDGKEMSPASVRGNHCGEIFCRKHGNIELKPDGKFSVVISSPQGCCPDSVLPIFVAAKMELEAYDAEGNQTYITTNLMRPTSKSIQHEQRKKDKCSRFYTGTSYTTAGDFLDAPDAPTQRSTGSCRPPAPRAHIPPFRSTTPCRTEGRIVRRKA